MKALLVIVALILAIPTYGISLIVLVGIIWYQGNASDYTASKNVAYKKMNEAVQKGEYREVQGQASQKLDALLTSEDFWYPVRKVSESSGVPPVLVATFTEQQTYVDLFFRPLLASGASNGLSTTELQMLCSDLISDFWNALSSSQKGFVFHSQNSGERYVDFNAMSEE